MRTLFRLFFLILFTLVIGWYLHPPLRRDLQERFWTMMGGKLAPAKKAPPARRARRAPSPSRPGAAASRKSIWEIQGEVYDLLTLKPVAGAEISFREDPTVPGISVTTDAEGKFSARTPAAPMKGLVASFKHPDYDEVFLEETRAPYKRWSLERRQDAYAEAQTAEVLHVPLFGDGAEPLNYNIAALSKNIKR